MRYRQDTFIDAASTDSPSRVIETLTNDALSTLVLPLRPGSLQISLPEIPQISHVFLADEVNQWGNEHSISALEMSHTHDNTSPNGAAPDGATATIPDLEAATDREIQNLVYRGAPFQITCKISCRSPRIQRRPPLFQGRACLWVGSLRWISRVA